MDLNRQASAWCEQINARVHSTTGVAPVERLGAEHLAPLPVVATRYLGVTRRVSREGFVSFEGFNYGVNWRYNGQTLAVIPDRAEQRIDIVDMKTGELIARHTMGRPGTMRYRLADDQYQGLNTPCRPWRKGTPAIHQIPQTPPSQCETEDSDWNLSQWDIEGQW